MLFLKKYWWLYLIAAVGLFFFIAFWVSQPTATLKTEIENLSIANEPENAAISQAESEKEELISQIESGQATIDFLKRRLEEGRVRLAASSETIKNLMSRAPETFADLEDCKTDFSELQREYVSLNFTFQTSEKLNREYVLTIARWKKINENNVIIISSERKKYANCMRSLKNLDDSYKRQLFKSKFSTAATVAASAMALYFVSKKDYKGAVGAVLARGLLRITVKI